MDSNQTANTGNLCGTIASSLYRLKDINGKHGSFFVFSDISIRIMGTFRLTFSVYKVAGMKISKQCSITSEAFTSYPQNQYPGNMEPNCLSQCFAEQGIKIRKREYSKYRKS